MWSSPEAEFPRQAGMPEAEVKLRLPVGAVLAAAHVFSLSMEEDPCPVLTCKRVAYSENTSMNYVPRTDKNILP